MRLNSSTHRAGPFQDPERGRLYLPALDGLRLLAFLAVLLHHVAPLSKGDFLYNFQQQGWIGVELFFVISSFLFFVLFQAEYKQAGKIAVGDFFTRRLLRLYPLMIAAPLIFAAVNYRQVDFWGVAREMRQIALFADNLLWLPNFTRAIPYAGHLWTLSFEFQVYLLLPMTFLLYAKLGFQRFLWIVGAVSFVCLILRAYYASIGAPHPTIYFSPILRPDSILIGMAIGLIASRTNGYTSVATVALILSAALFFMLPGVNITGPSTIVLFPAAAITCGSMLWLALKAPALSRALGSRPLVFLGKRSYGLYIFHLAAIAFSDAYILPYLPWLGFSTAADALTKVTVALSISVVMALISYRFFEKPFLRLKDQWSVVLSRPI